MKFIKQWGEFMLMGARAHARWEVEVSNTILRDRKRFVIVILLTIPVIFGGLAALR